MLNNVPNSVCTSEDFYFFTFISRSRTHQQIAIEYTFFDDRCEVVIVEMYAVHIRTYIPATKFHYVVCTILLGSRMSGDNATPKLTILVMLETSLNYHGERKKLAREK